MVNAQPADRKLYPLLCLNENKITMEVATQLALVLPILVARSHRDW